MLAALFLRYRQAVDGIRKLEASDVATGGALLLGAALAAIAVVSLLGFAARAFAGAPSLGMLYVALFSGLSAWALLSAVWCVESGRGGI